MHEMENKKPLSWFAFLSPKERGLNLEGQASTRSEEKAVIQRLLSEVSFLYLRDFIKALKYGRSPRSFALFGRVLMAFNKGCGIPH